MKRIRSIMVLCLSICWFTPAISQLRPGQVAEQFFRKKLNENQIFSEIRFDEPIRHGNIWIFECRSPAGFVLVRESDACQVVGYSIRNRFTKDDKIPDPALDFIESLSRCSGSDFNLGLQKTKYNPIGPLIRTTWSQETFFNYYCPEDSKGPDNHVYVGCAAVAMGQIIRYYGKFNDFNVTAVSDDFNYGRLTAAIGNFDWERMENRPITIDTEVSRLLFSLGVLIRMGYGPSASSTSNFNVYDGFKKLKYYAATRMVRSTTAGEVWVKNFHQNIADFQPVYISGSNHSFICDGIDAEGLFHFNLGWYGYADGYYPLSQILTISPSEAIFDLRPYTNNLPPVNLTLDTLNGQKLLKWEKHRLTTVDPVYYRVYLNDTTHFDTNETVFNTSFFPPGDHEVMVTAIYPQGESPWIGPIQFPVRGPRVDIPDRVLKTAIHEELIRENVNPADDSPTLNQLLKVKKLEIRQPLSSLTGLEYCHNLQILALTPDETSRVDLGPVSLLKRLKWLDLTNIESNNLELLAHNDRLIHLDLTRCQVSNLDFLTGISGLLSLRICDLPVLNTEIFSSLPSIKQLTLSGCHLSSASFVQDLTNLEYLDISRNQLQRIRLTDKLPELNELNISQNQINDFYFMEFIPNIQRINLNDNLLNRFVTGLNFKHIEELNLDNNLIDSIWISVPMPNLTRLSLSGNRIRNISRLKEYASGLVWLNLAGNFIKDFWKGSMQTLEYLDLSNNRLNLLNDLSANPKLKHIDFSNNQVADLYPVFDHSNSNKIQYLDLTGNPLSLESITDLAPSLHISIDTLLLPDTPQMFSPGNPQPIRNQTVTNGTAELSWQTGQLPAGSYYEFYKGTAPDSISLAGTTATPVYSVDIAAGAHYYWRIRTVLADTSFLSGLFNFKTYRPFSLPFKEDFESYPAYTLLTELSDCWIKAIHSGPTITDGRIDPSRKAEGKQSLKLINSSDLRLPMNHLYQSVLYISMQLLIDQGSLGSVRLNDINGANLDLYFKNNGRCDILINNKLIIETPYPTSEWFSLQISLYGVSNDIWVKIENYSQAINWIFTGDLVHIGELELASAPGPNWPTDGQALFHADNIEIKATGSVGAESVSITPEILMFPNPANEEVHVKMSSLGKEPDISLWDYTGRMIVSSVSPEGPGQWKINVTNLPSGLYLVRVTSAGLSRVAKFYIRR
jgi:hypothetical protein